MKIRMRRPTPAPGFSGTDGTFQTCVVEWGEKMPLPPDAEKVGDNTALSDWEAEKPQTTKKKEEAS